MSELPPQPKTYEEIWRELDELEQRKEYLLKLLVYIDRPPHEDS